MATGAAGPRIDREYTKRGLNLRRGFTLVASNEISSTDFESGWKTAISGNSEGILLNCLEFRWNRPEQLQKAWDTVGLAEFLRSLNTRTFARDARKAPPYGG